MNNRVHANAAAYNLRQPWRINNPIPLKLLIAMKLTAILLLAFSLQVTANALAQQITLKVKDEPFERVLRDIRRQSGYAFVYSTKFLEDANPVSVEVEERDILDALPLIFEGQPFDYEVEDKIILIKRKIHPVGAKQTQQQLNIRGMVTDSLGRPLARANVHFSGSTRVIITDDNGNFILPNERSTSIITITNIGYQKKDIPLSLFLSPDPALPAGVRSARNTDGTINLWVALSPIMGQLDETIIIGYGTTTQRLNTGSVGRITSKDIMSQPVNNPMLAMQGRIPGVSIVQNTGVPGGSVSIQIRGRNSISQGNHPLYIIDGVPFTATSLTDYTISGSITGVGNFDGGSPFNSINQADIESIEVLKDADATAIYGSRGANGVVLITTKKGHEGRTVVDMNLAHGIGNVGRKLAMLDTRQYLEMRGEALQNDQTSPMAWDYDVNGIWDTTRYTDWQEALIGGTASFTNSQVGISGGSNLTTFRISGGYNREGTVFPGSFSSGRGAFAINLSHLSGNRKFSINLSASFTDVNSTLPAYSPSSSIALPPNAPAIYDELGNLNWENGTWNNPFRDFIRNYSSTTKTLYGTGKFGYEILSGLKVESSFGYTKMQIDEIQKVPLSYFNPTYGYTNNNAYTYFGNGGTETWIIEPQITYFKELGESKLDLLIGSTFQEDVRRQETINGMGFSNEVLMENKAAAFQLSVLNNSFNQYRYSAIFGRINYQIRRKYLFNITGRRDASSRFGPSKRFANLGAIGTGWIFSEESFVQDRISFLNFGKIRMSYGITGNDQISDYQYLSSWSLTEYPYQGLTGIYPARLYNPEYGWEENKKLEGGVELSFLDGRISTITSFFRNRSSNQLVNYPLPPTTGFGTIQQNLDAKIQNSGLETQLAIVPIERKNWRWETNFNITVNRNKLLEFPDLEKSSYANSYIVGASLNILKVYNFTGVNEQSGVYEFEDIDNDGAITFPNDQQAYVDLTPRYYGGWQNNVSYKNWNLDFFFQFVKQNSRNYLSLFLPPGLNSNQPVEALERWRNNDEGSATVQKFTGSFGSAAYQAYSLARNSTIGVTDASFIRLKNVNLSYSINTQKIQRIGVKSARIYLQAQNLFTITNFIGLDPESGPLNLPPLRVFMAGVQFNI